MIIEEFEFSVGSLGFLFSLICFGYNNIDSGEFTELLDIQHLDNINVEYSKVIYRQDYLV